MGLLKNPGGCGSVPQMLWRRAINMLGKRERRQPGFSTSP
jgi:hypothetical protein